MSYLSQLFADIPGLLLRIPIILIALTVHECAHGWVAYRCGDPTAKNLGRLSLNPLKHLDPFGTICMFWWDLVGHVLFRSTRAIFEIPSAAWR